MSLRQSWRHIWPQGVLILLSVRSIDIVIGSESFFIGSVATDWYEVVKIHI